MSPKVKETPEQKQQRLRAESQNLRSMQEQLQVRTSSYQRLQSPRVSIATGRSLTGGSLVR
jgi:hypothetical protein